MPINQFLAGGRFSAPSGAGGGSVGSSGSDLAPNRAFGLTPAVPAPAGASSRYGAGIRVNHSFKIGPATQNNQIFQCPAWRIPSGAKFTLLAPNSNAGLAQASESQAALAAGVGDPVPNITPIDFPVENAASVYVLLANVGDFVTALIRNDG